MNKDVIYIDVDDDVTAIIGKIKKTKEKIVALVPPKHVGTLQSAVNLRLLDRMAKAENKQLVLITANQALVGLAASAQIPIAKNLQTKPELPEIAAFALDDADDVIDGAQIPVGDYAKSAKNAKNANGPKIAEQRRSEAIEATNLELDDQATGQPAVVTPAVKKGKNRPKIPNFDTFRKKLFLIIFGGIALAALLVWMFVFAPAANIVITASTTPQPINAPITLGGTAATDYKAGTVSSSSQQLKKDETIEFDATGQQDVGDKATGSIKISKLTQQAYGVPAGTRFTSSNGTAFVTDVAVTIPASTPCFPAYCAQSVNADITAVNSGTDSNGITGTASGPDSLSAVFQGATAGGTSKIAKVVSADDIDRAQGQLIGKSTDDQKKALAKQFSTDYLVIDSSFTVERAAAVSTPAVGQETSTGKATLTVPTTYTIFGIQKSNLEIYLRAALEAKLDNSQNQKIYDAGIKSATISNFRKDGANQLVTVNAIGRIGPKIDESAIKDEVKGKRYGEVQQILQSVDGIKQVDVQFSYFWVRTVPSNPDKISIEFKVEDAN